MKNKSALSLVEQSVMLLVFAWAAALCLQAFVWADRTARENDARDMAVVCAQNAAEQLKAACGEQVADGDWVIHYDQDWNPVPQSDTYYLRAMRWPNAPGEVGLGRAVIFVESVAGDVLFKIPAHWQEVTE